MALNYARMPGFGDLPGDSRHPGSPDYVEPAFGLDDAAGNVARSLVFWDEVGELVDSLAESRALIDWIAHNVALPSNLLPRFRDLDRHTKRMRELVDAEYAALNEEHA